MFYAVRCVIYNIYISAAHRNTQSCSFKLMLLLRIIDTVAVFNADIFTLNADIFTRDNSTAFNVRSLICIQFHIAFNTANCASHLLSVLVGVLVLLLFLANGKA